MPVSRVRAASLPFASPVRASGASNECAGFGCMVSGFASRANGQGSVALGYRSAATTDYSVALGYRATNFGRNGVVVIGATLGVPDSVRAQRDGEVRVRAPGGVALRTSNAASADVGVSGNTGCDLPAGSGSWGCASSRHIKRAFQDVEGEQVLTSLRAVPVTTWEYIGEAGHVRHMGPVAQDFRAAFGLGTDSTSIGMLDAQGVALAAVQALEARTRALQAENAMLRARLERLEAALQRMEAAPRR